MSLYQNDEESKMRFRQEKITAVGSGKAWALLNSRKFCFTVSGLEKSEARRKRDNRITGDNRITDGKGGSAEQQGWMASACFPAQLGLPARLVSGSASCMR